jgi:branched-chain amino acid transport system permease protein
VFDFLLHVATLACLYALLALSLNLQAGFGGLINFGQVALFGCGTYGAGLAFLHGFSWQAGLLLALLMALALGSAFARMGRSLETDYWAIATLSFAEIFRIVANNEDWLTGSAQGISGLPTFFRSMASQDRQLAYLGLCVGALVMGWAACHRITASRYGLSLKLLREEPQLARSLGYDVEALRASTMRVGAVIAALAGFLFAHYITFVGPDQLVASETFVVWAMVIIGGLGSHLGAIVGAFLLQFIFAFAPFAKDAFNLPNEYVGAIRLVLTGGGILAFLLWRSQGLVPEKLSKHVR